jgi:hypothetical protein
LGDKVTSLYKKKCCQVDTTGNLIAPGARCSIAGKTLIQVQWHFLIGRSGNISVSRANGSAPDGNGAAYLNIQSDYEMFIQSVERSIR